MLRIHFMQQWFTIRGLAAQEVVHEIQTYLAFANLGLDSRLLFVPTILPFLRLLKEHKVAPQI